MTSNLGVPPRERCASSLRPLPPALIGAALDCLAQIPDGHRLDPILLVSVARAIGCSNSETPALLTRIRAAAIIMNHPRWPVWPLNMKSASVEHRQIFDVAMLTISTAMKSRRSSASRAILSGTATNALPLHPVTGSPARLRFKIKWQT